MRCRVKCLTVIKVSRIDSHKNHVLRVDVLTLTLRPHINIHTGNVMFISMFYHDILITFDISTLQRPYVCVCVCQLCKKFHKIISGQCSDFWFLFLGECTPL